MEKAGAQSNKQDHPAETARSPKSAPTAVSLPHRKPNSSKGRLALIHPIAHIKLIASDLTRNLIAQFTLEDLPQTSYDDWINVAAGEKRHVTILTN